MLSAFEDYSRCPGELLAGPWESRHAASQGFFRYKSMVLFGAPAETSAQARPDAPLAAVDRLLESRNGSMKLAFDPTQIADSLRHERYLDNRLIQDGDRFAPKAMARKVYYAVRPILPVAVRKHAQRLAMRDWQKLTFPSWPVDTTVDDLMRETFGVLLDLNGAAEIPFIWFWPDGHAAGAIMTHDVETAAGRDFSGALMKMESERDIRSAFEVVPEERYEVPESYLDEIRAGKCEVCLHGLNHDGQLFIEESLFRKRAARINEYARRFGASGFRSPVMYRRVDWYDAFDFSYDMSLPNVAHLDPQRGGCCTVMPYFIGRLVELPLTTTQDYQLYHILKKFDLELWKKQCEILLQHHGLLSFIIHPDYTTSARAQDLYRRLLDYLASLRATRNVWVALPGDVDKWWRQRSRMRLERRGQSWGVTGDGCERARLAFAYREDGEIKYRLADRL